MGSGSPSNKPGEADVDRSGARVNPPKASSILSLVACRLTEGGELRLSMETPSLKGSSSEHGGVRPLVVVECASLRDSSSAGSMYGAIAVERDSWVACCSCVISEMDSSEDMVDIQVWSKIVILKVVKFG